MISTVTAPFLFLGNHPALDFLNTAPRDGERLMDYRTLAAWTEEAGLVLPEDAAVAASRWGSTAEAAAVLTRAHALRELFRDVVHCIIFGSTVAAELLVQLNAALREESGAYMELSRNPKTGGFQRITRLALANASDLLAPILRAMGAFLAEANLDLLRACEDPTCVLVFYDVSKNHARRWCSMEACGNRHKVNAYRARK
ncbi:CGNR zinc finger domain-containing protein [Pendulispora brunnea]|uniref:CGNR zinc finger domain-containing protein n=1 Tax=Pendulispora brunnea TaxID=2905690 RepID=A0ABZ2KNU1_9BACT